MSKQSTIVVLVLLTLMSNDLLAQFAPMPQRSMPVSFRDASQNQTSSILQRLETLEKRSLADHKRDSGISTSATQTWSGRIQLDHWAFIDGDSVTNEIETGDPLTDPADHIGFRRLRFGPAGTMGDNGIYKIEMDFANPGKIAFKDAYIGINGLPILNTLILGQQKRPYGLSTLASSRYNALIERPLGVEAFNEDARRIGIQSYGVSNDRVYNWRYGAFMSENVQNSGKIFATTENGVYQAEFAGRFAKTFWYDEQSDGRNYGHWGVSGSVANTDPNAANNQARFRTRPESRTSSRWLNTGRIAGADRYALWGIEGALNFGPLNIQSEYQVVQVHRLADPSVVFQAGHIQASYWLSGEHTPWNRDTGTIGRTLPFDPFSPDVQGDDPRGGAWQVAIRYSYADFTDDDIFGGVGNSLSIGLNYWWSSRSRIQINYMKGRISDSSVVAGENTSGTPRNGSYGILGVRYMVDF
ncbi:MAG TPA: porin [Planctomycetes bacterium]|nr:porin [Planctomycetota bacterium]